MYRDAGSQQDAESQSEEEFTTFYKIGTQASRLLFPRTLQAGSLRTGKQFALRLIPQ